MIDSTHLHNEINICKALLQTHETIKTEFRANTRPTFKKGAHMLK